VNTSVSPGWSIVNTAGQVLFPVALFDAGLSVWRRVERLDHGVGSFARFLTIHGRVRLFGRQFVVIFRDGATRIVVDALGFERGDDGTGLVDGRSIKPPLAHLVVALDRCGRRARIVDVLRFEQLTPPSTMAT